MAKTTKRLTNKQNKLLELHYNEIQKIIYSSLKRNTWIKSQQQFEDLYDSAVGKIAFISQEYDENKDNTNLGFVRTVATRCISRIVDDTRRLQENKFKQSHRELVPTSGWDGKIVSYSSDPAGASGTISIDSGINDIEWNDSKDKMLSDLSKEKFDSPYQAILLREYLIPYAGGNPYKDTRQLSVETGVPQEDLDLLAKSDQVKNFVMKYIS